VPVAPGQPLAVVLEAGEQVRQIVDGDRAPVEQGQGRPWEVKEGGEGSGDGLRPHVFVTVTQPGLSNGLIITTTKRAYLLTCKSVGKTPVRMVRWYYPQSLAEASPPEEDAPGLLPHPEQPMKYHVGYRVESNRHPPPGWVPRQILDSGTRTYIIFPEITLFETVPLIRAIGNAGPMLINSRHFLNVVILDQLITRLELRVGTGETADVLTISRGNLRTISCPDDPACPVWPAAASVLARRAS
jgi:type IV secretory pathway VirB9-like protein